MLQPDLNKIAIECFTGERSNLIILNNFHFKFRLHSMHSFIINCFTDHILIYFGWMNLSLLGRESIHHSSSEEEEKISHWQRPKLRRKKNFSDVLNLESDSNRSNYTTRSRGLKDFLDLRSFVLFNQSNRMNYLHWLDLSNQLHLVN